MSVMRARKSVGTINKSSQTFERRCQKAKEECVITLRVITLSGHSASSYLPT